MLTREEFEGEVKRRRYGDYSFSEMAKAEIERLREILKGLLAGMLRVIVLVEHRVDVAEVCYDWCPRCRLDAFIAAATSALEPTK